MWYNSFMAKSSEAQKKASTKYNKDKTVLFTLRLNRQTDADIIDFLERQENKSAVIKRVIRELMKGE